MRNEGIGSGRELRKVGEQRRTKKTKAKEKELVAILENQPPKVVIYVDIAIDGKEERRLSHYAPELYKFLLKNYTFQEQVGFFQILLPKNHFLTR